MKSETEESSLVALNNSTSEAFNNTLEAGSSHFEALGVAINSISNFMSELDISDVKTNEIIDSFSNRFNEAISNGSSPQEALKLALEDMNKSGEEIINLGKDENIKNSKEEEYSDDKFNLDFSYSPNTPEMNMLDDAINKGMTVEEALKYVNDKMFPESVQGPPTLAEFNQLKSEKIEITKDQIIDKEEKELSKIEADMDAESGNILKESSSNLDSETDKSDTSSTYENKDDDIS